MPVRIVAFAFAQRLNKCGWLLIIAGPIMMGLAIAAMLTAAATAAELLFVGIALISAGGLTSCLACCVVSKLNNLPEQEAPQPTFVDEVTLPGEEAVAEEATPLAGSAASPASCHGRYGNK